MRCFPALFALLTIVSCSHTPPGDGAAAEFLPASFPLATRAWECDATGYVVSQRSDNNQSLWVFLPGQTVKLTALDTADSFGNESVQFRFEDAEARLTVADQPERCQENRRASLLEDAKLRGVSFRATGNEPPWLLELGRTRALLSTGYDRQLQWFDLPPPATDSANRQTSYRLRNGTVALDVFLTGERCTDTMSDEVSETTVRLELDGRELTGCGQALY